MTKGEVDDKRRTKGAVGGRAEPETGEAKAAVVMVGIVVVVEAGRGRDTGSVRLFTAAAPGEATAMGDDRGRDMLCVCVCVCVCTWILFSDVLLSACVGVVGACVGADEAAADRKCARIISSHPGSAYSSAVLPVLSLIVASAPAFSSKLMTAVRPLAAAQCNGVVPSSTLKALTLARASNNARNAWKTV